MDVEVAPVVRVNHDARHDHEPIAADIENPTAAVRGAAAGTAAAARTGAALGTAVGARTCAAVGHPGAVLHFSALRARGIRHLLHPRVLGLIR